MDAANVAVDREPVHAGRLRERRDPVDSAAVKIALVVPGGFERPDGPVPPRRIPALHALVAELAREHEVHVFCSDFDERGGTWPFGDATVHDPGRVSSRVLPMERITERTWRMVRALRRASETVPFDVVHAFWVDGNGVVASLAARSVGVPLVASVGGGECSWIPSARYGGARTLRGRIATRAVLASARVVTVGSNEARRAVPHGEVEVVPLGACRAVFEASGERPDGPPWRLVHVANRNEVKDPWTLLAALRELVAAGLDVHLDWFGKDTLAGAVEERARAWNLDARVDFRGEQTSAEVARALKTAHVHVLSSLHESQCVAVLEAAFAQLPTVGTRVGLVADLAPDAAVAVAVGDASALATAVADLLGDGPRRARLGAAAQRYAQLHDARWTASTFVTLYARARSSSTSV